MGANKRLFLALLPPEAARLALVRYLKAWHWPEHAQRYAPSDWHLTLHFLGSVSAAQTGKLQGAFKKLRRPFVLHFGYPQLWPGGLSVLLPRQVPAELLQLHDDLGQTVHALGHALDERSYKPHVTMARKAVGATAPAQPPEFEWPVSNYVLMQSTGDPMARYQVLQRYGLGD